MYMHILSGTNQHHLHVTCCFEVNGANLMKRREGDGVPDGIADTVGHMGPYDCPTTI